MSSNSFTLPQSSRKSEFSPKCAPHTDTHLWHIVSNISVMKVVLRMLGDLRDFVVFVAVFLTAITVGLWGVSNVQIYPIPTFLKV